MRKLVFSILLLFSSNIFAKDEVISVAVEPDISTLQINQLFDETNRLDRKSKYVDLVVKEDKITTCITKYVDNENKSFTKIPQNDLYDLLNNFEKVSLRIQGRKNIPEDNISYEEKLEVLANIQCEAYYALGVLR